MWGLAAGGVKPNSIPWREKWESKDTFSNAYQDNRASVRSFDADLAKQISKEFKGGTISIYSSDKDREEVRMFADSQYTRLSDNEAKEHNTRFQGQVEG